MLASLLVALNNPQPLCDAFQNLERAGQFFLGMRGGDDGADAGFALRNSGEAEALGKHAGGKKLSRISSARVNSSCVCVAVTMVRMRALPSGTVGKPRL